MGALKAEGIVLRKYYLRETSYILVLYTKEFGKIKGVLKGVRKPFPQFAGNFEILSCCQVVFYKKKSALDLITQCEAVEYFNKVRSDIEKLAYANYFAELVDAVTADHDADPGIFDILKGSLGMLSRASGAKRVRRIFEIKLLGALGFSPQVDECVKCSAKVDEKSFFSAASGGIMCPKCHGNEDDNIPVSLGAMKFMRKIQASDIDRTEHIKLSHEVGLETEFILDRFVRMQIGRPIKALKVLNDIREFESDMGNKTRGVERR
jgi:DNA repair protein RecO (recombination protein O)